MTDDTLEAQARELIRGGTDDVYNIAIWARRLVAESRAGALREAARMVQSRASIDSRGACDHVALGASVLSLAAEAEPGAQG